jgi:hypothetical protein
LDKIIDKTEEAGHEYTTVNVEPTARAIPFSKSGHTEEHDENGTHVIRMG